MVKSQKIVWHKRHSIQNYFRIIRRILRMGQKEWIFRITKPVKDRLNQVRLFLNKPILSDSDFLKKFNLSSFQLESVVDELRKGEYGSAIHVLVKYYKNLSRDVFFFDSIGISDMKALFDEEAKSKTIQEANEILNHRFRLFGLKIITGRTINWHLDPTTYQKWPNIFWGSIPNTLNNYTKDIKYIWELNRHKHFVTLGKAYLFTGDKKYKREFVQQIDHWIDENPVKNGVNWVSNLEVAMRMISWIWAHNLFNDSSSFDDRVHFKILKSIYQHARHIFSELSIYTDPTNHLIGETTALWMIAVFFPEFKESQKWQDVASHILYRELDKQVHDDGVNAEQAISYHRFILDFYTQVVLLAEKNNISIPGEMMQKIEKMFEFIMELVDLNGRVPMIGDADDARGIPVAYGEFWDFRDSLSTGAVLFNRSDMKALAGQFHETSLWLFGLAGKRKFDSLPIVRPKLKSKAFEDSGYYIMKAEGKLGPMQMVFDCGPIGYLPNADHGHADMLSFTLNIGGEAILVDPGTFGYGCAGDKRDYFRGTRAHNTVVVDDFHQADPFGTFKWLNIPKYNVNKWITTERYDFIEASHNGYTRLKNPIIHKRIILFVKPVYWVVVDFLYGSGFHQYDQYFHFATGSVDLDLMSKMVSMRTKNGINFILAPVQPEKILASNFEGCEKPFEGWISYNYGEKVPASVVKYTKQSEVPTTFGTLLLPFSGETIPISKLELLKIQQEYNQAQTMGLKLEMNGNIDYFISSYGTSNIIRWEEYESDADLIYLRKDTYDRVNKMFLLNGSCVTQKSKKLLNNKRRLEYLEV